MVRKKQADDHFFEDDFFMRGNGGYRRRGRGDRRSLSRLGRRSLSRTHGGRPSRKGASGVGFGEVGTDGRARNRWMGWWPAFYTLVTCCCPNFLLSRVGGMHQSSSREAWREKVALCVAITILCGALAFLTFGFSLFVCQPPKNPVWKLDVVRKATDPRSRRYFIIHGQIYNIPEAAAKKLHPHSVDVFKAFATQDISPYFPFSPTCPSIQFACRAAGSSMEFCHKPGLLNKLDYIGDVAYEWKDIGRKNSPFIVYNGEVLDLSVYLDQVGDGEDEASKPFGSKIDRVLREHLGKDASRALSVYDQDTLDCLFEHFRAGLLDVKTMGCVATDIVLYVSLVVILSLVFAKFFLAIGFAFVMSRRLGRPASDDHISGRRARRGSKSYQQQAWGKDLDEIMGSSSLDHQQKNDLDRGDGEGGEGEGGGGDQMIEEGNLIASALKSSRYAAAFKKNGSGLGAFSGSRYSASQEDSTMNTKYPGNSSLIPPLTIKPRLDSTNSPGHMYTILLVTCYSEDEAGLRVTLDSLTSSDYDDSQKLLFVVADGIIKGSGNDKSTPDMIIGMMEVATDLFEPYYFDSDGHPLAHSYVAIADGTKRHNMARVYPGYYRCGLHRVPMILVVKCGTPAEADKPKPGNRGKRDSQIIIMSFLNKCLFDDRMTPLDFDLFYKITRLTGGVTPDNYELILMVDADTKVMPSALGKLVQVMRSDETIMGCCGETRIANKSDSWVTAIQVFEYYISHHLSKAFESIFGGVTCLPGCFCMYRIKAPKGGKNHWVPIVANPEIVDAYSENVTDTLHKRNLLLLGEDRYLTTLMLKTFPRRKLIFVPQAICKTMVPDEFRVLLSQRRRWINSTVHNLFELVLVNDLCGTFCCSMQFVVFIELIGTLVLPAAITFTGVLIASTFMSDPQWIPLFLLAAILGLPALLILFTARHPIYVIWFFIYLAALPVWNFVLPVYAYWHMDDFSWGETRKVDGGAKGDEHGKAEGTFDASHIFMKRWHEFELERIKKAERFVSKRVISKEEKEEEKGKEQEFVDDEQNEQDEGFDTNGDDEEEEEEE